MAEEELVVKSVKDRSGGGKTEAKNRQILCVCETGSKGAK